MPVPLTHLLCQSLDQQNVPNAHRHQAAYGLGKLPRLRGDISARLGMLAVRTAWLVAADRLAVALS